MCVVLSAFCAAAGVATTQDASASAARCVRMSKKEWMTEISKRST
jgi:hypothetical protein